MKVFIFFGGKGICLCFFIYIGVKQLVFVVNKLIFWYGIEAIVKVGIIDIGIIISLEMGEEIKIIIGNGEKFGIQIIYIL